MSGVIGSKRWGAVGVVLALALTTYLVLRPDSARELAERLVGCVRGPCDGDDPATVGGTRTVDPRVRVWSRTITLRTADGGASARIENGQPGDTVWLDRGGPERIEDGNLGATSISAPDTAQHTGYYRYAGSALRACGRAGDRPEIRCTRWTAAGDPPPDRDMRAVDRLLERYDHRAGLWENDASTWQSANALTAVLGYVRRTGDRQYLAYLDETYRHGDVARIGIPRRTGYNDDELWWALAWIQGFDLTRDPRYLTAARTIVDGLDDQRTTFCGGGLAWARIGIDPDQRPWEQVNTITNALYLTATARLSTRVDQPDRARYLAGATAAWSWFETAPGRALLDPSGLVDDHLLRSGDTCVLDDENRRWTYDQGMLIDGLVALYQATGNDAPRAAADRIAAAATRDGSPFIRDGILVEAAATDCPGTGCRDVETFKGVFVRAYRDLLDTGRSTAATAEFLTRQADSLRDRGDEYGFRWRGPVAEDDRPNFATQAAAVDALTAAIAPGSQRVPDEPGR